MTETIDRDAFDIRRVMRRTYDAIAGNLMSFLAISALLVAMPHLLSGWLQVQLTNTAEPGRAMLSLAYFPVSLVVLAAGLAGQAALIASTVAWLDGRPLPIDRAIAGALPHLWRLFCVVILLALGIGCGSLLLVVPGFVLMVRWLAAMPVQVIENRGARASLGRSAELTKGRRWPIFGLVFGYSIVVAIVEFTLMGAAGAFKLSFLAMLSSPATHIVVLPLLQWAAMVVGSAGVACIYYELTGGRVLNTLAAAFD